MNIFYMEVLKCFITVRMVIAIDTAPPSGQMEDFGTLVAPWRVARRQNLQN